MELELVEALCGFHKVIETLDQRNLVISSIPGEVIKTGEIKCIMNEGMPINRSPHDKGKLIIHFNVKFPELISLMFVLNWKLAFHQEMNVLFRMMPRKLRYENLILRHMHADQVTVVVEIIMMKTMNHAPRVSNASLIKAL
ncbi:DnaJ subfamily A member 1 [Orchesella cincta]|uniref:DnaJ subfamily A member 1 n=1 Tax=Orchesella cincta TaxID=48709 RepID=A0A1D2M1T9_ORCCI|nr:DnaJ subfamily A member 1 [Orchesella cincta]